MKKISMLAMCAALAGFCATPVLAESGASTSSMAKHSSMSKHHMHSARSIECSKEANAKGLHGKARKKFREACKHHRTDKMAPAAGAGGK